MLLTIIYGLICLISGSVAIDYIILAGTVCLDAIGMITGAVYWKTQK